MIILWEEDIDAKMDLLSWRATRQVLASVPKRGGDRMTLLVKATYHAEGYFTQR